MTHKFVILDEIMSQLESAVSGVDEGSVKQAKVSGIQNVPTSISQKTIGGASSTSYTTFPLSPLADCCNLDKSYLYLDFDVNLGLSIKADTAIAADFKVPIYFGFRDTTSMFSQVQFLIGGSTIWQTVYQREESVLSYNSLPEREIETNEQYASIDKMRLNLESPMYRIEIPFVACAANTVQKVDFKVNFKLTVDINRLSPLLSNLHYTTPHMGNLRLKVFMQEIEKALFFCPDYSAFGANNAVKMNQYWQFYPLNEFYSKADIKDMIPFVGLVSGTTPSLLDVAAIKFVAATDNFLSFERGTAEIIQTTFAINNSEYQQLNDYFTNLGSVIIPTNVWSTNVFNNSNIPMGQWNSTMIGNISGYNIDTVSIWTHPIGNPCCMSKEFLTGVQCLLEGRPINPVPYECYNGEFITDMSQAIADTDEESVNKDYMRSLTLFNRKNGAFYPSANVAVDGTNDWIPSFTRATGGIRQDHIGVPNTFVMNFNTNLPDSFHTGACTLEDTNKQSVIRFISTNKKIGKDAYPYIINGHNSQLVVGFSCLCDACIVLSYDPARGTCFNGQLSWAAPYAKQ